MSTRSQRHMVNVTGRAANGSDISQGGVSPLIQPPVLISLVPNEAFFGDADVDVHVHGENFTQSSVVVAEIGIATSFVSDVELIVTVKPSFFTEPASIPVHVQTGPYYSDALNFVLQPPLPPGE